MKNTILFILVLSFAILGGLGLFFFESKLPDNEIVNRDIYAQLLKIDSLNSSTNELVLRNRANLDLNYDMLVRSTNALDRATKNLEDLYFKPEDIKGSLLETQFNRFKNEMDIKADHIENFKSSNSVLRNSDLYMPLVGSELANIARESSLPDLATFYDLVIKEVLQFTRQGSTKPKQDVVGFAKEVLETETLLSIDQAIKVIEFSNHVATAIASKESADKYLKQVLSSSSNDQVEAISSAWAQWVSDNSSAQKTFHYYMIGYIVSLLLLIGFLIYRLRTAYANLDKDVEDKTVEIKKAYKDLRKSEQLAQQSEKMAMLGQLVKGVAQEINTPLSYISSNVTTVKTRFTSFTPVINVVQEIDQTISKGANSGAALTGLLKQQVVAFRKIDKRNTPQSIDDLLGDAEEGLVKIKGIVDSLDKFNDIQSSAPREPENLNDRIKAVLNGCRDIIGERDLTVDYVSDIKLVEASAEQIDAVLLNIITNAVEATKDPEGKIVIRTKMDTENVEVIFFDDGAGILDYQLERVFEPFFTTKKDVEGAGLGLPVARQIIEGHGGELNISSKVGTGTTVKLMLPFLPSE